MTNAQNLHALLDQTGWIHALARRLVADPHLAADLAQATCVDALEREPDASRPLRGWLAAVMRNNLAKLYRTDRNRAAREKAAQARELEPATLDVVEKAEIHRNLVLAVLALEEPYRSTLLMRFFEQLSYADIARRTNVTRATVNSRVTRGLEQLRRRLESTYGGDRRALYLALTPLAKLPTGASTTILGVKTMHAAIGTAAATLLAVTATVTWNAKNSRTSADAPTVITMEPGSDPVPFPVAEPVETSDVELSAPTDFSRSLLESLDRLDRAMDPAGGAASTGATATDEQVWSAELFHTLALSPAIESLSVNASSGDIEVVESGSGNVEIRARVRAKLARVSKQELVQVFEQHVDVIEDERVLRIEDKHRDSRGWSVSFVVHVPGTLPLKANSGSGDIVVRRSRGEVRANTGSGDVKIDLPAERVSMISANTGSGSVVAEILSIEKKLDLNTGSGHVTLRIQDVSSPGAARLNSGSGDARLVVPPGINGAFELETHGEAIRMAPALRLQEQVAKDGKRRVQGSVGGGGGSYKLTSGTGELEIEIGFTLPVKAK